MILANAQYFGYNFFPHGRPIWTGLRYQTHPFMFRLKRVIGPQKFRHTSRACSIDPGRFWKCTFIAKKYFRNFLFMKVYSSKMSTVHDRYQMIYDGFLLKTLSQLKIFTFMQKITTIMTGTVSSPLISV